MKADVCLALDLEATLIISAHWPWSRPGLREFLDWAGETFERIVIFTAVEETLFKNVADFLISRGEAPPWFGSIDHFRATEFPDEEWCDKSPEIMCKDLKQVCGDIERVVLVDDHEGYVIPSQKHRWVKICPFDGDPKDRELTRVREELTLRLRLGEE